MNIYTKAGELPLTQPTASISRSSTSSIRPQDEKIRLISSFSSSEYMPASYATPVMPSPRSAGVLGMALTTLTPPPSLAPISCMEMPGASEMITWSLVSTSFISSNTTSKYWGFTARTRYFTWAAHSRLEAAWATFVSDVTWSIFS